jgi:hypothetical protein
MSARLRETKQARGFGREAGRRSDQRPATIRVPLFWWTHATEYLTETGAGKIAFTDQLQVRFDIARETDTIATQISAWTTPQRGRP